MYSLKKFFQSKVIISLALIFFLDVLVFPSYGNRSTDAPMVPYDIYWNSGVSYIQDVLRTHRTGLSSLEELRLAEVILGESESYSLDPLFVMALIKTESTFYNWSRSRKGALGLMQIRPGTGMGIAGELDLAWEGAETLFDPFVNVKLGVYYFSSLKDRFDNDIKRALAAYNFGPSYLNKRIRKGKRLPQRYANKVLANYENLKEGMRYY